MALIECPDCGKQVSDAASTCISCGRPLHGVAVSAAPAGTRAAPVLIEQSSKKWKAGMLLGIGAALLGFVIAGTAPNGSGGGVGLFLLVAGVLIFLFSAAANWWGHG